ncbi:MAG: phenylalanine-4-hydroxylase, partial [Colwellia sp.]
YWFTVEFGLLDTPEGIKIYGGGILSSPSETHHATGDNVEREKLEILDVLRTPYRIDVMQPIYYMLNKVSDLDNLRKHEVSEIMALVEQAEALGLHPAKFPAKEIKKAS